MEPTANLDPILRRRFWEEFRYLRKLGRTLFVTTQYVGEAELCDHVGLLSAGKLVAAGTPGELRRRAFDGEFIQLVLSGDPGSLGGRLEVLERFGRVEELRKDEQETEKTTSRVRLLVEDADAALPEVMEVLDGAEVLSADIPKASFDEVFFRLVEESEEK
jgi:ABC-2 type transport system ATP-binding protein